MINEPPLLEIRRSGFARPDPAQIAAFAGVPTGYLCDAMEGRGALSSRIRPVCTGGGLPLHAHGPALVAENGPADMLATKGAMHVSRPGDMIVVATDGHLNCAALGDNYCRMFRARGAAGVVSDGMMRDYDGIVAAGLPAWCAGLNPNSPFSNGPGRVGFGAVLGGVRIDSGDMIVADRDGVVVVPFARINEVIARLDAIRAAEAALEARIDAGLCDAPLVAEMIADGRAILRD